MSKEVRVLYVNPTFEGTEIICEKVLTSGEYAERAGIRQILYNKHIDGDYQKQSLAIKRLFVLLKADYIVADLNWAGKILSEYLIEPTFDSEYSVTHPAYYCVNNEYFASRCRDLENSAKVLYDKDHFLFNFDRLFYKISSKETHKQTTDSQISEQTQEKEGE